MDVKYRKIIGLDEIWTLNFWRSVLGEFLATFFFIIIIVGSELKLKENQEINNLQIAVTGCFAVSMLVSTFWDISGGNFNPAVSLTFLLMGESSILRFCAYVVVQCIGTIAGCGFLHLITPNEYHGGFGVMSLHPDIQPGVGFLIEVFLGSLLMLTVVTCTDPDRDFNGFQAPFAIGVTVAVTLFLGIPYTGVSLNPIRPLGPAVLKNSFKDIWVWILGPLTASIICVPTYKFVLKVRKKSKKKHSVGNYKLNGEDDCLALECYEKP